MRCNILIFFVVLAILGNFALADCPSADLNGDCFVDFEDFALIATQWLTTDPCVPEGMVYIPDGEFEMGDHLGDAYYENELPIHPVLLDSFFMSKFEITNQQYCDYLNSAYDANEIKIDNGIVYSYTDDSNSYPYCHTHSSSIYTLIDYNDMSKTFSVRTKGEPPRDMSDDPIGTTWYGSVAYCNWRSQQEEREQCYNLSTWDCDFSKKGYRLATEVEWEYAARGGLSGKRFPWADLNILHSQANYFSDSYLSYDVSPTRGYHPTYKDGIHPYTAPVGSFPANGYGLFDMAGNVWEWCNDWYSQIYYIISPHDNPQGPVSGDARVLRGGCWFDLADNCRVACRHCSYPYYGSYNFFGFRIVLDLN